MKSKSIIKTLVSLSLLIFIVTTPVYADTLNSISASSYTYDENTIENTINDSINSVVMVEDFDSQGNLIATGSGCIISADGKVVTNYHVVNVTGVASEDVIMNDGVTKYTVKGVLGYNKKEDIAVLKLNAASGLTPLNLGNSDSLKLGQTVLAIGSPEGLENTVSLGIVSGLKRDMGRGKSDLQISIPIQHGSSGGALLDVNGNLVGITYAGLNMTGDLNFSIPINDVKNYTGIDKLTTIAEINNDQSTDNSAYVPEIGKDKCFPKLSDLPLPEKITYDSSTVSSDGKEISYSYNMSKLTGGFFMKYDRLIAKNGYEYEKSEINDYGYIDFYYINPIGNEVKMGMTSDNFLITGIIH